MIEKRILLSKKPMVIIGIVVSILIIIGGYLYYTSEKDSFREKTHNELKTISDLKISQILNWRKERIADAKVSAQSEFFGRAVAQWIANRDNLILKKEIEDRLRLTQMEYIYEDICITTTQGELLLSLEDKPAGIDSIMKQKVINSAEKRKIIFSDFYKCQFNGKIHLTISSPLIKGNEVYAVMVFIIDPNTYLFPLIQSWPTTSETAETLLLRKDGDGVLFINELRHMKNTALELRIPLTEGEISEVQAVSGYEGIFEGKDYRGVDVLPDIRKIPGTQWYMISKIDRSEVYSDLRYKTGVIIGFISLLIFLLSIGLVFVYNYRQADTYKELYLKEKELGETQEEFRTTLYSIGDGVITTDIYGNVRYMNHVAEELTGWRELDASGRPLEEVFKILNEDTGDKVDNPVDKILREGVVIGLANHTVLIHKKGKQVPIADSGAPIYNENKKLTGVVLVFRDQTEERKHQKALQESEERYRTLFDTAAEGILIANLKTQKFIYSNPAISLMFGYSELEFRQMGVKDMHPKESLEHVIAEFEAQAKGEKTLASEIPCLKKDGSILYVDINTTKAVIDGTECNIGFFTDITERKQAEEMLRESEKRYHLLVENVPSVLWKTNEKGITTFISPNIKEVYGYTLEEIYAGGYNCWFGRIHDDDLQEVKKSFEALFSDGKKYEVEYRIKRKDGKWIWVNDSASIVLEENGESYGYGVFTDITERKQAEKSMRQASDNWRATFDAISDIVMLLNPNHEIIELNKAGLDALNISREDVVGKKCFKLVHNLDEPIIECPCKTCVHEKKGGSVEYAENGRIYELIAYPVFDENSNVIAITHIVKDITERKHDEALLIKSEAQLSNALEIAQLGHWEYDVKEDLFTFNNQFYKIFKTTAEQVGGYTMRSADYARRFVHPDDMQMVGEEIRKAIETTDPNFNTQLEHRILYSDGTIGFIIVRFFIVKDDKGNTIKTYGVNQDITKRKQREEEILISREKLRNLSSHLQSIREEERGVISREIHDDLGQSLTALKMDMSWFKKHLHEGDESSEKKIKGMIELVDATIKSVQRISTELRPAVLDDIGFSAAVKWFIDEFRERSELKCQLYIKPDEIVLDEKLSIAMYRIFQESLTNIMRHAKASEVNVKITLVNDELDMSVADDGIGIDETKLKDSKSLGLIGMQERVYPWHGTVEITGEKGKGTVVKVNVKF